MAARQFYAATPVAGPLSHTGDTVLTDAITLTFTPDASSSYYLLWSCERSINSASNRAEVDFLNATTPTTLGVQGSTERTSGDWMTTGGVSKETFGASPAPQTYKTQYKTTASASTAKVRDLTIVAVKAAATDVDSVVAGPITGTNTTLADVTGGPSVTVGAGTWLILASAELGNSASANFTRAQLTDGTNNYGTASLSPLTTASTVYKGWMTAVKVTTAGSTTYKLQASASAGTWSAQHLAIIAIDLSTFDNSGYQADLTRSSVVNPAGAWTTRSSLAYTPPAASLNHLVVHAMALDESGSGVNGQGRGTLGGVTQWASSESANAAFSTLEQQAAFGFYTTALAAGATTITNDFTSSTASATVGCAASVIAVLQLDASSTNRTGTAAQTLPSFTQAAAGTRTVPTFTGIAAQILPSFTQAAAGTSAKPVFTGSSAQILPSFTQSATGTRTVPTFTATSAQTLPSLTQSASGTRTVPTSTGTAAQTLGALTQAAAGTVTAPTYTATSAQTLPSFVQAAAGTITPPAFTGTAEQTLPTLTQAAAGTATQPTYTATADQTLPSFTQQADGTVVNPSGVSGTAAQTLPSTSQTAAGTVTAPVFTGSAEQALPSISQAATGSSTAPTDTGAAAQTLPSFSQTATGTVTQPVYTATSAQTLPGLTQTGVGTSTAPTYTATAASVLAATTQHATGTVTAPTFTASAAQTLPAIGQTATGTVVAIVTPTPAERVYVVAAETRVYVVARETRHITVAAESRTTTVPAETRTIRVPAENRTVEVV